MQKRQKIWTPDQWTPEQLQLLTRDTSQTHGKLLTLGYTEPDARKRLEAFMEELDTRLIDIRYAPRSQWRPEWNKSALSEKYGLRYAHLRELGNVNYKRLDEPIELLAPEEGVRRVVRLLQQGQSVVLLCACQNYDTCHRKTVYELIMAAMTTLARCGDKQETAQIMTGSTESMSSQEPVALPSARKINWMIDHNTFGGGGKYVRCEYTETDQTMTQSRIIRARTRKGQLEVRPIGGNQWVVPMNIWES